MSPATPVRRHAPAGRGEAVLLRGAVDLRPGRAAADPGDAPLRVDLDEVDPAHVEHDALAQRAAGDGVAAGAHGDLEALRARRRRAPRATSSAVEQRAT